MEAKVLDSKAYWLGINIFMVAAMVIIGGITRITNSGLSMTEWNFVVASHMPTIWVDKITLSLNGASELNM